MSKGQKRSSREVKKPKQVKPKVAAAANTSSSLARSGGFASGKNKKK